MTWRSAVRVAVMLLAVPAAVAHAQNGLAIGGASVVPGQTDVVLAITAITTAPLTGLDAEVDFDASLCGRIENQTVRAAGRTAVVPLEGSVRCPGSGSLAVILFDPLGDAVVPPGDGVIAEWVFTVRSDASGGSFPLALHVNQARNGPLHVAVDVTGAGTIFISGATATPTATVDTPTSTPAPPTTTNTPVPTDTPIHVPSATATQTAVITPAGCVGDCDARGSVGISELIIGVNISLGLAPLDACTAFDRDGSGDVSIAELITAVNNALNGCSP